MGIHTVGREGRFGYLEDVIPYVVEDVMWNVAALCIHMLIHAGTRHVIWRKTRTGAREGQQQDLS